MNEIRRWIDSTAFRIEITPRGDLLLIPLPEPTDDYVDVPLGKVNWNNPPTPPSPTSASSPPSPP